MTMLRFFWLFTLFMAVETFVSKPAMVPRKSGMRRFSIAKPHADRKSARRKELLTRRGPHFQLDRRTGKIEFGATANLVTTLGEDADFDLISTWLQDERGRRLFPRQYAHLGKQRPVP